MKQHLSMTLSDRKDNDPRIGHPLEPNKWDLYFLRVAREVSKLSKDPSTQCGAVLVRPDATLCSTGYNGFARGMEESPAMYADRDTKLGLIIHAEMNAILFAAEKLTGYSLYTYPLACCDRCAVHALQAGITTFVFPTLSESLKERWGASTEKSKKYFKEHGLVPCGYQWKQPTWREIDPSYL